MRSKLYQIGFLLLFLAFFSAVVKYHWASETVINQKVNLPEQPEVIYGLAEPIKTLDPAEASNSAEAKVLVNIFEGLVRYKANSTEIEPALATDWEISPDGRSWVFHLRRGVVFHDGTKFNAQAVKFSVERQLHPLKKDTMTYGSFTFGMVKSVEILDDYTVKFNLNAPYSPFLRNLAMPWAAPIVSPGAVTKYGEEFYRHPVGTGPFYLADWRNDTPVLLANDHYWGGTPRIKSVGFANLAPEDCAAAIKSGKITLADINSQENLTAKNITVISQPGISLNYLGLFNNRPPFNNDKVRRAVCMAVDRQAIAEKLFANRRLAANSVLPPKVLGYSENLKPYSGGPQKARALLSNYGYPDGVDITLITYDCQRPYNPLGGKELAQIIKDQLAQAGIRVKIKAYAWHEFKTALRNQSGDAFLFGWVGDNLDPDNFLYTLLSSSQIKQTNLTHYKNSEVDRLISAAQKELNEKTRERLYFHAQQIILQDTPAIFLNFGQNSVAISNNLKGVGLNPYGLPLLATAYILNK
ncbi:ABC transporter substrate-binding protein [Desulfotomaculum nigrificans]|uniref:ABC transporter substrate-binding protein n=1 Tax=Desulfotomaculum nigrificans TaxID=1565 RepID=UPI0001FAE539|nr:ABC transporter substrate-binding protein [Desulfotomaculum nigrificans]